ncbi:MAG TPA: hypothetical protein VMM80_03280 [Bacteroidota bacterium]|nr:hypothetical protein [Bacteroidota bacterium]
MTHATALAMGAMLILSGCASSRQRLEDVIPDRVYHRPFKEVFEAIRLYSLKEGFKLDRYGEDAGRVIGHKNTSSSSEARQLSSLSETATMVVMNLKMRRMGENETGITVNFAFENGHVVVSREEESILLDCYNTFFDFMKDNAGG